MWLEIEKYRAVNPDMSRISSECLREREEERLYMCESERECMCDRGNRKGVCKRDNGRECVCMFYCTTFILTGLFFEIMCCILCVCDSSSVISPLCFLVTSAVQASSCHLHHFASPAPKCDA